MWPPRRAPEARQKNSSAKEEAGPAKQEPSANIYCCQSCSACGGLSLAGVGPIPTTRNTKALDLIDSLSVKISFNQNSMLTSLLRGHPELCTHTDKQKHLHKRDPGSN